MTRFSKEWPEESVSLLLELYSYKGPKYCALKLNKTESSVRAKASRLGLNKSITKTHDKFLSDLKDKNINLTVMGFYINGDTELLFKCPEDHVFSQRPRSVLERSGRCPKCTKKGFDDSKQAILYFVLFKDLNLYKLGITNRTPKERLSPDYNKYNAEIIWEIQFETGLEARSIEKELKILHKDKFCDTGLLNTGNTETLLDIIEIPFLKRLTE